MERRCDKHNNGGEPLLHVASANGRAKVVAVLLKQGASVNSVDCCRRTALHLAANAAVAEVLLERGDADVNAESESRETPLYNACLNVRADVVALLLKNGADVNGNALANPLRVACSRGNSDIVKLLLSYNAKCDEKEFGSLLCTACKVGSDVLVEELVRHGASVNAVDRHDQPPLLVALEARAMQFETCDAPSAERPAGGSENNMKVIDALLANGADPNATGCYRGTPFLFAVRQGIHDVIDKLIDHGADVNLLSIGKYPITTVLSSIGKFRLENKNKSGSTSARQQSFVQTLTVLLRRRVNLNVLGKNGDSPLYMALRLELLEAAKVMIKTGADTNLTGRKRYPLIFACSKGLRDVAESLLDAGADPDVTDWSEKTPLRAAVENFDELTTSLLLSWKADPNAVDRHRDAPLHHLLKCYVPVPSKGTCSNLVDLLIKSGARVNAVNDWGETALYLACVKMDLQLIEMLLNRGADPNVQLESGKRHTHSNFGDYEDDRLPLFVAVSNGNQELFKLLLDHGADINLTNERGMTVVHRAVSFPGISSVSSRELESMLLFVLSSGAGVDVFDKYGQTALYRAACETRYRSDDGTAMKVVGILLDHGADVNGIAIEHARIPLAAACWAQNTDVVKLFISKGAKANVSALDRHSLVPFNDPFTPLCIAVCKGNHTLASLLLESGADVNLVDIYGQTALHFAVNRMRRCNDGTDECVRLLLHHGADFNVTDDGGETPLCHACRRELPKTVTMMLEYRKLINRVSLHQPLLAAVKRENEGIVELLLAQGADPDVAARDPACSKPMDSVIRTPLCVAADVGSVNIVRRLLAAGASANAADGCGRTPIHHVIERYSASFDATRVRHSVGHWRRYDSVADLLLEAGSDLCRIDPKRGSRPFKVVISSLTDEFNVFGGSATSRRALFKMLNKLFAHGAVYEEPAAFWRSRENKERGVYKGLGEFMLVLDDDYKWIVQLFKAGLPNHLLVMCCLGMPYGDLHYNCTALARAVVLNKARLDPSVDTIELSWQTNVFEHRLFESWVDEDMRQPSSLMRLCRVVVRTQLSVASGGRTILPSIERLPLPLQLLQYLAFEGVFSEVDLTLSDDDNASSSAMESWEDDNGSDFSDSDSSDYDDDEDLESDEAMSPATDNDGNDDDYSDDEDDDDNDDSDDVDDDDDGESSSNQDSSLD